MYYCFELEILSQLLVSNCTYVDQHFRCVTTNNLWRFSYISTYIRVRDRRKRAKYARIRAPVVIKITTVNKIKK